MNLTPRHTQGGDSISWRHTGCRNVHYYWVEGHSPGQRGLRLNLKDTSICVNVCQLKTGRNTAVVRPGWVCYCNEGDHTPWEPWNSEKGELEISYYWIWAYVRWFCSFQCTSLILLKSFVSFCQFFILFDAIANGKFFKFRICQITNFVFSYVHSMYSALCSLFFS